MNSLSMYLGSIIGNNDIYLESLLDDDDVYLSKTDDVIIKKYINDNYTITGNLIISKDRVVDCGGGVTVDNWFMTSLTNGLFRWGKIKRYFDCNGCYKLETLEGAPKKVGGRFDCRDCESLTSLDGAPEEVGGTFCCNHCIKLKNLKGAPKSVGGGFYCGECPNLKITASDREKYKIYN